MSLICYNYTGVDIIINGREIKCGKSAELHAKSLQIQYQENTVITPIPEFKSNYTLIIAAQMIDGSAIMLDCVNDQLHVIHRADADELLSIKVGGIDVIHQDKEHVRKMVGSLSVGRQISHYICETSLAKVLNLCNYNTFDWLLFLIILIIILAGVIIIMVSLKKYYFVLEK